MITFTLDTNCIIDVDEGRLTANSIQQLVNFHDSEEVDVALVAVSASEKQQGDTYLNNYKDFEDRILALGFGHLPILKAIGYHDISYWDKCLYADEDMTKREEVIHDALFPNISFLWADYADLKGVDVDINTSSEYKRWRNAFCDRQMFWAHDNNGRDVFVTSDKNFQKLANLSVFSGVCVLTPAKAIELIK